MECFRPWMNTNRRYFSVTRKHLLFHQIIFNCWFRSVCGLVHSSNAPHAIFRINISFWTFESVIAFACIGGTKWATTKKKKSVMNSKDESALWKSVDLWIWIGFLLPQINYFLEMGTPLFFFVCVYIYLSSIFYWNVKFTVLLLHVHLNCFFFTIQKCISLYGPYLSVFLRQMRWLSNKFTFRTARFCVHSHIHTHTHTHRNCTVESDFSAKRTTASHMC